MWAWRFFPAPKVEVENTSMNPTCPTLLEVEKVACALSDPGLMVSISTAHVWMIENAWQAAPLKEVGLIGHTALVNALVLGSLSRSMDYVVQEVGYAEEIDLAEIRDLKFPSRMMPMEAFASHDHLSTEAVGNVPSCSVARLAVQMTLKT